ncbi:hypothetical protein QBC39DRAFT_358063 [Podospora conica]|nr:hypothetical protein QBC39DRAFT_358063 [Schizothecium conicum]
MMDPNANSNSNSSQSISGNPSRRTFKFHSKVKSGCLTCKARKVKCDEEKPSCRRCTSTGRTCDGYRSRTTSPPSVGALDRSLSSSPPALFASAAEKRSFHFFHTHASKALAGYSNLTFWNREVMQAAIHSPPIRNLVVALGAAYQAYEHGDIHGRGEDDGMAFALRQSNKSIRQLALAKPSQATTPSAEATSVLLTASVLFIYLAILHGHINEAIQHVRSAVKLLQAFDVSWAQQQDGVDRSPYPVRLSHLRTLLRSVYGQLRSMIDETFFEAGDHDILVTDTKPATLFLSVDEAHVYAERLFYNTLALQQDAEHNGVDTPERLVAVVKRHGELCRALESSQDALDVLAASLDSVDPQRRQHDERGIAMVRVYHLMLAVRLRIDMLRPEQRESSFDDMEIWLEEMLAHCEFLVDQDRATSPSQPLCSSGLGYVMPLHTIAARCRNSNLRKRAMHLLLDCPRRDGLWDGSVVGKIVSHTVQMEEQAAGSETGRVRQVKIELQGERKAVLRFVTVGDWLEGRNGTSRVIQW